MEQYTGAAYWSSMAAGSEGGTSIFKGRLTDAVRVQAGKGNQYLEGVTY